MKKILGLIIICYFNIGCFDVSVNEVKQIDSLDIKDTTSINKGPLSSKIDDMPSKSLWREINRWKPTRIDFISEIILYETIDNKFMLDVIYTNGNVETKETYKTLLQDEIRLDYKNEADEYYIIESDGNLGMYNPSVGDKLGYGRKEKYDNAVLIN